jgi:hypothetical protein
MEKQKWCRFQTTYHTSIGGCKHPDNIHKLMMVEVQIPEDIQKELIEHENLFETRMGGKLIDKIEDVSLPEVVSWVESETRFFVLGDFEFFDKDEKELISGLGSYLGSID